MSKLDMGEISNSTEGNRISVYLEWMNKEQLITGIDFQRNFVWPVWKRSNLIMSAVIDILIPPISVYRPIKGDKIKKVFDGRQRLTTFQQFKENMFALDLSKFPFPVFVIGGTEYNREDLNGKFFEQLSEDIKERFLDKNIKMEILSGASDEMAEVFFSLMNMGQEALRPQQIRVATMGKKTRDFFNSLNPTPLFTYSALSESQRINNTEHDILGQIALLYGVGITDVTGDNVDGFINQFRNDGLPEDLQSRIKNVVEYLSEVVEILVAKKKESTQTQTKGRKADPNKPVKITYLNKLNIVSCAYLAEKAQNLISPVRFADFIAEFFNNVPSAYRDTKEGGTAKCLNVKIRLNTITERFEEWGNKNSEVREEVAAG